MDRSMEIQATASSLAAQRAGSGTRLVKLRQKLAARAGGPGYEKNCEALRAEIARLEGSTVQPATETTSPEASEKSKRAKRKPKSGDA